MLEFIFFHQSICDKFTEFLVEQNIEFRLEEDDGSVNVSVSEDLDGALIDNIDMSGLLR